MTRKILGYLQLGLIIALVLLTGYLAYKDYIGGDVCLPNSDQSQCNNVQSSNYGSIFGVKLGYFGFVAFVALLLIYLGAKIEHARRNTFHKIFLASSVLGALFAAYFLYIQFFVLKQICESCMIIDGIMIAVFVTSLFDLASEIKANTAAGN